MISIARLLTSLEVRPNQSSTIAIARTTSGSKTKKQCHLRPAAVGLTRRIERILQRLAEQNDGLDSRQAVRQGSELARTFRGWMQIPAKPPGYAGRAVPAILTADY